MTLNFVVGYFLFVVFDYAFGLTCFNCRGISHPRFCEVVQECSNDQICGIEREMKTNGDILFNIGCMNPIICDSGASSVAGLETCIDCCSTDLCNKKGCGEREIPIGNGTTCYSCSGQLTQDPCHTVRFCESFEKCYIEEQTHFGEKFYETGCKVKHICDAQFSFNPIIGRRNIAPRSTSRYMCCYGNLCNDIHHMKGVQSVTTPLSSMQTTTIPTTAIADIPSECADINFKRDGVYTIIPKGGTKEVSVYCIMRGSEKWTVIQRRIDGQVDFYRRWTEYEAGFGSTRGEYWLGNENIHLITANGDHELSVYFEDFGGMFGYANYTHFLVGDASTKYKLTVTGFVGKHGDGMQTSNGKPFSTKDQDNDSSSSNCAVDRHSGWWFNNCDYANLNGLYNDTHGDGPYWYYFHLSTSPLKSDMMMVRRKP